jgi:hypothetical protein
VNTPVHIFSAFGKFAVAFAAVALVLAVALLYRQADVAERELDAALGARDAVVRAYVEVAQNAGKGVKDQLNLGEALAAALALLPDAPDGARLRRILADVMESEGIGVRALGIVLDADDGSGASDSARAYAYRGAGAIEWLNADDLKDNLEQRFGFSSDTVIDRPAWKLVTSSPVGGVWPPTSLLVVPARTAGLSGAVAVEASVRWLEDALEAIQELGDLAGCAISPDGLLVRLEGDRLAIDDAHTVMFDGEPVLQKRRTSISNGSIRDFVSPAFWTADIIDSGWLLVVKPAAPEAPTVSGWSVVVFLVVLALLAAFAGLLSPMPGLEAAEAEDIRNLFDVPAEGSRGRKTARDVTGRTGWRDMARRVQTRFRSDSRARTDSELRVARQIQFSLIPSRFPPYSEWREFDLYSFLSPERAVGGDYYDFFMRDVNRFVFVVGDVSGKGIPAAIYMAVCRTAFRALALQADGPGELLTKLNDQLIRDNQSGMYITLACFFVNLPTGECRYALGGHVPPLLHRRNAPNASFIEEPHETLVGMKAGTKFPEGDLRLDPGDSVFMYTDGMPEAKNLDDADFGYDRVKEVFVENSLRGANCRDIIEGVEKDFRAFLAGKDQEDDITALAFRYWGLGGRRISVRANSPGLEEE